MSAPDDIRLDVCGLEPPEPLERILDALTRLQAGQQLRVLIPRQPYPLYRILDQNGYLHDTVGRDDGLFEILIRAA